VLLAVILVPAGLMSYLLGYHVHLVRVNMTTNEHLKKSLVKLPVHPFNYIGNELLRYVCHALRAKNITGALPLAYDRQKINQNQVAILISPTDNSFSITRSGLTHNS